MASRRKKRKPRRQPEAEPYPGWMWMLFGLAIGLSVAFAIYQRYEGTAQPAATTDRAPASMVAPIPDEAPMSEPEPAAESEPRFSFYSMLPDIEVTVTEDEAEVRPDRGVTRIEAPGVYVLQAGSFSQAHDAERRKAELALLGVESRVQRVSVDDRTVHRVRIGPLSDLNELNAVRGRLREADIDVLRIRLGD